MMSVKIAPLREMIIEIRNGLNAVQYDEPSDSRMLPITRIETISAGIIDFKRVKYVKVSEAEQRKYQLRSGDILFSHINSPEHIGKTAIFRSERTLLHGINLLLLRPNLVRCYPEYLNYYLRSFEVRARFRTRCKKAVNQASLNHDDIVSLEVPIPPLSEQKRIAAILEKADRLRHQRHYALELSDTYLQSVFLEMFGDPLENPRDWGIVVLGEMLSIPPHIGTITPAKETGEQLCVRVGEVGQWHINLNQCKYVSLSGRELKRFSLLPADIVLARAIGSESHLGKLSLMGKSSIPVVFDSHLMRLRPDNSRLLTPFLAYWLKTDGGRARFMRQARRTAVQFNINTEQISSIEIPVPPLLLQQNFAKIVEKYECLYAQQYEAERQAEHLFQTLLHQAFQGNIDIGPGITQNVSMESDAQSSGVGQQFSETYVQLQLNY